ncbi:MAG: hypothetical protein HQM06_08850 [Magnetococcales bacterium]|nr:hypothetical protein [Magnetococcales bacterium]
MARGPSTTLGRREPITSARVVVGVGVQGGWSRKPPCQLIEVRGEITGYDCADILRRVVHELRR